MPANSICSGPVTSTFNAMCFDENPFTCRCEKENTKAEGFQISHFYWLFSSDKMTVKELNLTAGASTVKIKSLNPER